MSSVIIGVENGRREPVMGADLIKDLVPFQPTTARAFAPTDTLRVFSRLFWGAPASDQTEVDVTLTIRGGRPTVPQTLRLISTVVLTGRREAALDSTLPLKDLATGPHVLEVAARLANGQTARREIPFDVR